MTWYNSKDFYFNELIEEQFDAIRTEALSLLPRYTPHDNDTASATTTIKLATGWRMFSILRGRRLTEESILHAPVTVRLLSSFLEIMQCSYGLAYFSFIPAGGVVAPHVSTLKPRQRIRHQLCLSTGPLASITVVGDTRKWQEGKVLTFDDAYRHSVENLNDTPRIVLIYDSLP